MLQFLLVPVIRWGTLLGGPRRLVLRATTKLLAMRSNFVTTVERRLQPWPSKTDITRSPLVREVLISTRVEPLSSLLLTSRTLHLPFNDL